MRTPEPQLHTARLTLRPLLLEDFGPWAEMMSDSDAARFIGGVQARAVSWRGFMTMAGAWQLQGFAMFSVIERASGRWIGRLGPWYPEGWPGTEIGWAIVRDCWGRGYATEGAAASMDWAFEVLGWNEAIHSIAPDNIASQVVARKLGSSNRGPGRLPAPFESTRVDIWGQTRAEWLARRALRA
ncbi:MAG TPA: GNAT family N-acetyltransferase [Steroidobacteraceae bacterium]|jgi:RimJ/RimL family protein N-acetyltransferase